MSDIPLGADMQLRVRARGLANGQSGEKGDLFVVVNIVIPEQITEEERELWKNLKRISPFNPGSS